MSLKIIAVFLSLLIVAFCRMQRITVKGQLACDNKAIQGVLVKLIEKDTLDPDDLMATTHSDRQGYFEVTGEEDEVGSIEPFLQIIHNCLDGVIKPVIYFVFFSFFLRRLKR
ncbi:unnamed protein product [Dracunculus medinensis]|uniref:Transthyretin-like family protein n=1 Tax=Dracunculus medinensis TaxID=318479 RepID=A0A0N4U407_DRAME|nr:unnamed protein product [Dracunculus medinensis]